MTKRRFRDYVYASALVAPAILYGAPVLAAVDPNSPTAQACTGIGATIDAAGKCVVTGASGAKGDLGTAFKQVANTLIFIVGALSIIMVIIGGLRYVLSGGDSAGIKSAKDTVLYALIGVGVAIVAFALVNFVITAIK